MVGKKKVSPEELNRELINRELTESIAKNLYDLATSVNALLNGPLKKRALLVLLANSTGMSQVQVNNVLTALENLEKDWLKSPNV